MRVCVSSVNKISASIFSLYQIHAVYDCNRSLLFMMIALLVADSVGSVAISVLKVDASETCVHVRLLGYHLQRSSCNDVGKWLDGLPTPPATTSLLYFLDPSAFLRIISPLPHAEKRLVAIQEWDGLQGWGRP
jgi:hypothetical protein